MQYYIENNSVFRRYQSSMSKVDKEYVCTRELIVITPEKPIIQLNEVISVNIICYIFDINQVQYITDADINKAVDVIVNGEIKGQLDIVDGVGQFEFESSESGTFKIEVESAVCEVIVE